MSELVGILSILAIIVSLVIPWTDWQDESRKGEE